MKSIKITNAAQLASMIEAAEGRATARTITPEDITEALEQINERILLLSTRKDATGTTIEADPNAQQFPNAYKYTPESTHFTAELKAAGWKVTRVYRSRCWSTTVAAITFTPATIANMAARAATIKA
jgi:ribosomal protein S12 methylthiotransferase accessory factor YcaO